MILRCSRPNGTVHFGYTMFACWSSGELPLSIVQFSTEIFYANEDDGTVMVDVVRPHAASRLSA
jgi:hypothetical protein